MTWYWYIYARETGSFLVRGDQRDILDTLKRWKTDSKAMDQKLIAKWKKEGYIFPSSSDGIVALQAAEKTSLKSSTIGALPMDLRPPSYQRMTANVYVNIGADERYEHSIP
jgi:hypothetical protein